MTQNIKSIFQEKYVKIKELLQTPSQVRTDEDLIDMRNVLESFPFFIQFANTKSQDFITMCRFLGLDVFPEPCLLFSQGDIADKFYMILKGSAQIYVRIPGANEEKSVGQLSVGGSFGELALLFDSERNATIKVDSGTELIVLHKDVFKKYMKFQSSEHANQAFTLLNSMDEFKPLEFPERVRMASKMDFKAYPSNYQIIQQGQNLSNFMIVQTGMLKFYRDILFNTQDNGQIGFKKTDRTSYGRKLKIEIDEVGPGRFFGEYELQTYKTCQYTAVTTMPTTVFLISQIDFNLMSPFQLKQICKDAKPYPSDEDIRSVFLEGVQWRVFRKQLVDHLSEKKWMSKIRDPSSVSDKKYNKDLKMFALNTLSFNKLMDLYIEDGQSSGIVKTVKGFETDKFDEQAEGQMMFGTNVKIQRKPKHFQLFSNVDTAIKTIRSKYEMPHQKSQSQARLKCAPTTSKQILPKINPKVGSNIYNILISN